MKKILLPGMLASIAFAACTNEELVPQQTIVPEFDLSSRPTVGQVDVVFGAQTRMGLGEGYNGFDFKLGDKLGARLIDVVDGSYASYKNHQFRYKAEENNYGFTNYAYTRDENGKWATEALLVEGNYMFYAPYNEENRARTKMEVSFPITQTINPNSEKVALAKGDKAANVDAVAEFFTGEAGHTAFIGHYFLDASNNVTSIAPAYNHLYAYPVITLNNDYKVKNGTSWVAEDVTINKVIISSENIYSHYNVKNDGVMNALRANAVEYDNKGKVKDEQKLGSWRTKDGADAKSFLLNEKTINILAPVTEGENVENGTITVVFEPALVIEAGESFSFHVVMPAAVYETSKLTITPVQTESENVQWQWNGNKFVHSAAKFTFAPGMWCPTEEYNVEGSKPAYKATAGQLTEYTISGTKIRYQEPAKDLKSAKAFAEWLEKNNFDHSIALEEGTETFTFAKQTVKIADVPETYSVVPFNSELMKIVEKYLVTGSIEFASNMLITGEDDEVNLVVDGKKYIFSAGLDQEKGKLTLTDAKIVGNSRFFGEVSLKDVTIEGNADFYGKATLENVTVTGATTIKGANSVVKGTSDLKGVEITAATNIEGKAKATSLKIKGASVTYSSENKFGEITVQEGATLNLNMDYTDAIKVGAKNGNNMTKGIVNINAAQSGMVTLEMGDITINKPFSAKNLTWNGVNTTTLTNNSTISDDFDVPTNATYVHNGVTTGTVNVAAATAKDAEGTIENYKDIEVEENNGTIKAIAKTTHTTVNKGNGTIENNELAYVKANADQTVSYTFASQADQDDLVEFKASTYSINKYIFANGLYLANKIEEGNEQFAGVKTFEFKGDLNINENAATFFPKDVETIEISSSLEFGGFEKSISRISFKDDVDINVAEGKELTVQYLTLTAYGDGVNVNINLAEGAKIKVVDANVLVGKAYVPVYSSTSEGYISNGFYTIGSGIQKKDMINDGTTYEVYSYAGLLEVVKEINADANHFQGKTVKLMNNIDLDNEAWTPIAQFLGTFDGQGNTISNLYVSVTGQAGFFGVTGATTVIQNLNIDGAQVTGTHWVGAIAAGGYGAFTNCIVNNAKINCNNPKNGEDGDKAGAVIGFHAGDNKAKISDCQVKNSTVKAGRDAGQVVGAAKAANVVNCSAVNTTVAANGTATGENILNEVVGRKL